MNASERLKVLARNEDDVLWSADTEALWNALPQIVVLVKILECRHSDPDNSGRCIKCQATLDEGQPWDDALTALDEALSSK